MNGTTITISLIVIIIIIGLIWWNNYQVTSDKCTDDPKGQTVLTDDCVCGENEEICNVQQYCYQDIDEDELSCHDEAKDLCKPEGRCENGVCNNGECTCNDGYTNETKGDPTSPCSIPLEKCTNDEDCNGKSLPGSDITGFVGINESNNCDCRPCIPGWGGKDCNTEESINLSDSDCYMKQQCALNDNNEWTCIGNNYLDKTKPDCLPCPDGTSMYLINGELVDCVPDDDNKYLDLTSTPPQLRNCITENYHVICSREGTDKCTGIADKDCVPRPGSGIFIDSEGNPKKCGENEILDGNDKCVCDISKGFIVDGDKCKVDTRCQEKKCGDNINENVEDLKAKGFHMLLDDENKDVVPDKVNSLKSRIQCSTESATPICKIDGIQCGPNQENKLQEGCDGCDEGYVLSMVSGKYKCIPNPCNLSGWKEGSNCFTSDTLDLFTKNPDGEIYSYKITGETEFEKLEGEKIDQMMKDVCPTGVKCKLSGDKHELDQFGEDKKYFTFSVDPSTQQHKIKCNIPSENRKKVDGDHETCSPKSACLIKDKDGKWDNYCPSDEGSNERIDRDDPNTDKNGCYITSDGNPACKCTKNWTHEYNKQERKCSVKRKCPEGSTINEKWDDGEAQAWLTKNGNKDKYYPGLLATKDEGKYFNAYVKDGEPVYKCTPSDITKNPFTGGKCNWWQYLDTSDGVCYPFHETNCSRMDMTGKSTGHYYDLRGDPKCSLANNGGLASSGTMKNNECCKSCSQKWDQSSEKPDGFEEDSFDPISSENKSISGETVPLKVAKSFSGNEKWEGSGYNSSDTYYQLVDGKNKQEQRDYIKTSNKAQFDIGNLDEDLVTGVVNNLFVCTKKNPPKSGVHDDPGDPVDEDEIYFDPDHSKWRKSGERYGFTGKKEDSLSSNEKSYWEKYSLSYPYNHSCTVPTISEGQLPGSKSDKNNRKEECDSTKYFKAGDPVENPSCKSKDETEEHWYSDDERWSCGFT